MPEKSFELRRGRGSVDSKKCILYLNLSPSNLIYPIEEAAVAEMCLFLN